MPLALDKVHTFTMVNGTELLTGVNCYRRFERRSGPERTAPIEVFIVQGGEWYDQGGHPLKSDQIPDWVWEDCRAMEPFDRGTYRIVLPEEAAKGYTVPSFGSQEEWPTTQVIWQTLMTLDKSDDTHWTKEGLPNLDELAKRLGSRITRRRLEAVAPRFVRPA